MKLPINKLVNNTGQIEGLPANPRQIDKTDYERLLKSLKEDPDFLIHKPLHVYEHNDQYVVLGGNQRLRALKELGYKEVPVTVYDPETPVEVLKRRIIIDNSTFGDYDMDMLANEGWETDELVDWGVDLPKEWGQEYGDEFSLDDSDKSDYGQMTFMLAEQQSELIKEALNAAKNINGDTFGNQNSNGNALYWIVEQWLNK